MPDALICYPGSIEKLKLLGATYLPYNMVCQQINCIDNDVVKHLYPKGNEHNCLQAKLLVKGGNVDYSSIEF
jgi:hypothetical protein